MEPRVQDQYRVLLAIALIGAGLLLVPFPGSLSVVVTRSLVTGFAEWPRVALLSEVALSVLALVVVAALVVGRPWRSRQRLAVLAAVIGVPVAYLISELTKLAFAQPRPCTRWAAAVDCPPPGDWSLPSNHAVLAFAAVAVIAFALRRRRLTWVAVALAVTVSIGRIMQGAHYLHDVAAGALLGIAVPLAFAVVTATVVERARRAPAAEPRP